MTQCLCFYFSTVFKCGVNVSNISDITAARSYLLITDAGIAAGVGRVFSHVCLSVCPRSNRKTAFAINTKLGTCTLYSSHLECMEPEVKKSKVKVTQLRKPSRSHGC